MSIWVKWSHEIVENEENTTGNEFRGSRLRIFVTQSDNPENGRIFVWTKMGWFERLEGASGDVAFTPIAQSEDELNEYISRDDPSAELVPLGREYRKTVSREFMEQAPSPSDSHEYSNEEPSGDEDQEYHQHDL